MKTTLKNKPKARHKDRYDPFEEIYANPHKYDIVTK